MKELFADGVQAIHVTGNLVRIDLMSLEPQKKDEQGEKMEVHSRLILPLEGFLAAANLQENLLQELKKEGRIKKKAGTKDEESK